VSDVSSVIFRDLILWIFFFDFAAGRVQDLLSPKKAKTLASIYGQVREQKEPEDVLEQIVDRAEWGDLT
jgi:hypothetical protein